MATVTGLTAARMLGIEAASIVDGHIDGAGHLILTTQGGTEIDAGSAIGEVPPQDVVKYLDPAEVNQATLPIDYPMGLSLLYLTATDAAAGGWTSFLTKWGTVRTIKPTSGDDIAQIWMHHADETAEPELWIRNGNWSGWGVWRRLATTVDTNALDARLDVLEVAGKTVTMLDENSKAEADAITTYPVGVSVMSVSTGSGWSINSGFGLIVTYYVNAGRNRQIFYSHNSPSAQWTRVSHTDFGGWSSWRRAAFFLDECDAWISYTPTWTAATTNPVYGNATVVARYKQIGKTVHFKITVTMGSTTTYGASAWRFGLPVAANALSDGTVFAAMGVQGASSANGIALYEHSNTAIVVLNDATDNFWTATNPHTWATGGIIRISGTYEAA